MYVRRTISILAAAISIGVCVFITYISRDVDQGTIVFNLIFLAAMLIMIAASCIFCLRRLMSVCKGLKNGIFAIKNGQTEDYYGGDNGAELFQNEFLDDCYHQYCRMSKDNPSSACDIQNFINEDAIETHVHRGLLELIPDVLTSLGILGTFVGLVMGLQGFDPSGYAQMAGSITPLINGIKVAFITSIYGISLSLAFSYNLRSEFGYLSSLMEEFLETYYLNVRPPYEVDSLARLVEEKKSQEDMQKEMNRLFVHQMVQSFEQVLNPSFNRMTDSISQVVEAFTENQQKAVAQICETVVSEMRTELASDLKHIEKTVNDLDKAQHNYSDFMNRSMEQMQQNFDSMQARMLETFTSMQGQLQQTCESMQEQMTQMNKYSDRSYAQLAEAQQETLHISQEQKATYQEYIRFMYQSIEKFSEVWEKNGQKMMEYSDEIAKLGPVQFNKELRYDLSVIAAKLQNIERQQKAAMTADDYSMDDDLADMLRNTLRKLDDLEEIVSAPLLFRSRAKRTKGK